LAFFFSDIGYATKPSHDHTDLWEITKRLNDPQFKIRKDMDYRELAALISILDIAIDNGQSTENDLTDSEVERDFNTDVDDLADRIKIIWSTINDAGASFMSRIDAKEVMEGLRNRLIYGVRTKLKPKQSIFDSVPDNSESLRKQSAMMSKYFKRDANGS
jgi:predicted  nucleic acid-binding Zn-ribbon protein